MRGQSALEKAVAPSTGRRESIKHLRKAARLDKTTMVSESPVCFEDVICGKNFICYSMLDTYFLEQFRRLYYFFSGILNTKTCF